MKEAREEVQEKFELMFYRLEGIIAMNGIDFSPELSGFVADYNAVAKHYKNVLAIERGRRRAAKAGDEKDDSYYEDESDNDDSPENAGE